MQPVPAVLLTLISSSRAERRPRQVKMGGNKTNSVLWFSTQQLLGFPAENAGSNGY
jgi:hypothetical protein